MHVSDDPRVGTELAGYRIESLLGLRWDERRLPGRGSAAEAEGRAQAARCRPRRGRVVPRALPARVGAGRVDRPSEHRPDLRGRDDRGSPFHRHALRRGTATSEERLQARPPGPGGRDRHPRPGRERPRCGPRTRPRASRREALERAARHGRPPRRLRPRLPGGLRPHEAGLRGGRNRRRRPPHGHHRLRRPRADRR